MSLAIEPRFESPSSLVLNTFGHVDSQKISSSIAAKSNLIEFPKFLQQPIGPGVAVESVSNGQNSPLGQLIGGVQFALEKLHGLLQGILNAVNPNNFSRSESATGSGIADGKNCICLDTNTTAQSGVAEKPSVIGDLLGLAQNLLFGISLGGSAIGGIFRAGKSIFGAAKKLF